MSEGMSENTLPHEWCKNFAFVFSLVKRTLLEIGQNHFVEHGFGKERGTLRGEIVTAGSVVDIIADRPVIEVGNLFLIG